MDVHSKEKELKKLIKDQEKLQKESSDKFNASLLDNYNERMDVVKELIENENQTNSLRDIKVAKPARDDKRGMDKNRHVDDQMNDLERAQQRLIKKLRTLEGKWE